MMSWWANHIASWVSQLSGLNSPAGAVLAAIFAAGLGALAWHRRRRKEGKAGVENSQLLLAGIAGTWLFLSPPAPRRDAMRGAGYLVVSAGFFGFR